MPTKSFKRQQKNLAKRLSSRDGVPTQFNQKNIGKRLRSTKGVGDELAKLSGMSGVESRKTRRPKDDPFNQIGL